MSPKQLRIRKRNQVRRIWWLLVVLGLALLPVGGLAAEEEDDECKGDSFLPIRRDIPDHCEGAYDDAVEIGGPQVKERPSDLFPLVKRAFGERFAASWLDRSVEPTVLRVGVVNATDADLVTARAVTGDTKERVWVVSMKYSFAQLKRYRRQVEALLEQHDFSFVRFGINGPDNRVEIGIANPNPELGAAIEAAGIPSDAYAIMEGEEPAESGAAAAGGAPHEQTAVQRPVGRTTENQSDPLQWIALVGLLALTTWGLARRFYLRAKS